MNDQKKLSLEGLNFEATKIDISQNILTITLNRPERKNALNNVMMNELNYALAYAKQEREIRERFFPTYSLAERLKRILVFYPKHNICNWISGIYFLLEHD